MLLSASEISRLASDADRGLSLPRLLVHRPRHLRGIERERIFRHTWQYVGRTEQVAEWATTSQRRSATSQCRRAHPGRPAGAPQHLPPPRHDPRGRAAWRGTIQCPYHAWTYGARWRPGRRRGQGRARFRQGGARPRSGPGGHVGAVRVREPGPGRASRSRRRSATSRRSWPRTGSTDALASTTARPGVDQRQLEDRDRELPRVLPLPAEPSRLDEGDRRGAPAHESRAACASARFLRSTPTLRNGAPPTR